MSDVVNLDAKEIVIQNLTKLLEHEINNLPPTHQTTAWTVLDLAANALLEAGWSTIDILDAIPTRMNGVKLQKQGV